MRNLTRAEQKEITRRRLLQATVEIVLEKGYADATPAAIAERAGGYTSGAVQGHFASKADAITQATRWYLYEVQPEFFAEPDPNDPVGWLFDMLERWLAPDNDPSRRLLFEVFMVATREDEAREFLASVLERRHRCIHSALELAAENGQLPADADTETMPFAIGAILPAFALHNVANAPRPNVQALLQLTRDCLLEA